MEPKAACVERGQWSLSSGGIMSLGNYAVAAATATISCKQSGNVFISDWYKNDVKRILSLVNWEGVQCSSVITESRIDVSNV